MFNFSNYGFPICKIVSDDKKINNKIISLSENNDDEYIKMFPELELKEKDGSFQLIPNKEADRSVLYFAGPAGVGKSYAIGAYLKEYVKAYKEAPIFLISEKESDKALDVINKIKRIKCDDNLIDEPLDLKDFIEMGRCCVIFDDIDSFAPKLKKAIYILLNKLLKVGRSYNITVLVSSHSACDGKDTKSMLGEATHIIWYPSTYNRSIKYLCENYVGMNKQDIIKMRKNKSRWCCYIKTYPSCIVQEKNIWRFGLE